MVSLRKVKIRTRLNVLAGTFSITLIALAGVGLAQITHGMDAARQLNDGNHMQHSAATVKYDLADLNGWQNAYAFEVASVGPKGAQDTATNRAEFLKVAARTRIDLQKLHDDLVGDSSAWIERAQLASSQFDQFMSIDQQIAALYRTGKADRTERANTLVNVDEVAVYTKGAKAVADLESALADSQTATGRNSQAVGRSLLLRAV
jgi:methyl-accepting chemotaxis protein